MAPGGTRDIVAFREMELPEIMKTLPTNQCLVGDNACTCSKTLLTPFSGAEKHKQKKSCFNFFLSQLRIRVEMAFGMLVGQFCMFKRPLRTKLTNSAQVFMCVIALHHFCINKGDSLLPSESNSPEDLVANFDASEPVSLNRVAGASCTRRWLVEEMAKQGMQRPQSNIQRNQEN